MKEKYKDCAWPSKAGYEMLLTRTLDTEKKLKGGTKHANLLCGNGLEFLKNL